jgi:hypothetical protein
LSFSDDRIPFTLPLKSKDDKKDLGIYHQKISAIIKVQAIKVIHGSNTDFDKDISSIVEFIWQDGYSEGLKDMDKMHKKIDAMIDKARNI